MTKIAACAIALSIAFIPVAYAAGAPKTKADCEKAKMVWDDATKTCKK
jgi:hypothetical protein